MSGATRPSAIRGTWTDLERRADFLYTYGDPDSDAHEMAEAVLVLLAMVRERDVALLTRTPP